MNIPYSAVITVKSPLLVDLEFARPLSPETASKLSELKRDGVSVSFNSACILISLTPNIDPNQIATECVNVLQDEGFDAHRILCKNFIPNISQYYIKGYKNLAVESEFREKIGEGFQVMQEGLHRFRIFTPVQFNDGDHLSIVMKKLDGEWILSDEGHTYLHLSYRTSLATLDLVVNSTIVKDTLLKLSVENRELEFVVKLETTQYAPAIHKLIHVLLTIILLVSAKP